MALRVLDLGAHDGFVSAWLRERFEGELELCGVELHPGFAAKARERGIDCKVGSAEAAPDLFPEHSFDVVLLFEVLEHVPDMGALLDAAERMLKPTGRVMVSTPDGCFGDGNNPHHLRALRAVDLADLLRRRGRLVDMEVGRDGITAAAYEPAPRRGEVAIYTGPSWMRWSPADIVTRGLGGSETAAVRLAEHLSFLGYVVTVYGEVEPCAYRDVIFKHHAAFDPMDRVDCIIASRMPELADRPLNARRRILWAHDTDFGDRLTQRRADAFDAILALSEWHLRHLAGHYPFAKDKLVLSRNGIELAYFKPSPAGTPDPVPADA